VSKVCRVIAHSRETWLWRSLRAIVTDMAQKRQGRRPASPSDGEMLLLAAHRFFIRTDCDS